jgi:hypothetical protein
VLQTPDPETPNPSDLEAYIREASEVKALTQTAGFAILERDLLEYRNGLVNRMAYIDPSKPEFRESRILFIAVDKIFSLINDYEENRDRAIQLLQKMENPDLAITMDIDTE